MKILLVIVIGFFAGLLARLFMPGRSVQGFVMTSLLGIAGALVGKLAGQAVGLYSAEDPAGFIASVLGAMIILFFYNLLTRGKGTRA